MVISVIIYPKVGQNESIRYCDAGMIDYLIINSIAKEAFHEHFLIKLFKGMEYQAISIPFSQFSDKTFIELTHWFHLLG